jgi:hypothetical protein
MPGVTRTVPGGSPASGLLVVLVGLEIGSSAGETVVVGFGSVGGGRTTVGGAVSEVQAPASSITPEATLIQRTRRDDPPSLPPAHLVTIDVTFLPPVAYLPTSPRLSAAWLDPRCT